MSELTEEQIRQIIREEIRLFFIDYVMEIKSALHNELENKKDYIATLEEALKQKIDHLAAWKEWFMGFNNIIPAKHFGACYTLGNIDKWINQAPINKKDNGNNITIEFRDRITRLEAKLAAWEKWFEKFKNIKTSDFYGAYDIENWLDQAPTNKEDK